MCPQWHVYITGEPQETFVSMSRACGQWRVGLLIYLILLIRLLSARANRPDKDPGRRGRPTLCLAFCQLNICPTMPYDFYFVHAAAMF